MRAAFPQLIALSVSACWLAFSQQAAAQGSFIWHTMLQNPNPGGIFGDDGYPVYTPSSDFPSVLPVDLNHDGIVDYRVVATGTVGEGFQIRGEGNNATWSRPAVGRDLGSLVVPLNAGTTISSLLPVMNEWSLTQPGPFETIAPTISAYSSSGPIGLFVDQTAFAGLQFYVGPDVYYGWMKVQEIPFLQGGGIVYEYAFDTRPNTPIFAGAVPEPSTWALLVVGALAMAAVRKRRKP